MLKSLNVVVLVVMPVSMLAGCGFDGGPVFDGSSSDHQIRLGGATEDAAPLSLKVRTALRKNAQTSLSRIQVSGVSDDSVKLTGYVNDDAIRQEAERVAGNVPGVRFVVNNLDVRK